MWEVAGAERRITGTRERKGDSEKSGITCEIALVLRDKRAYLARRLGVTDVSWHTVAGPLGGVEINIRVSIGAFGGVFLRQYTHLNHAEFFSYII